MSLFQLRAIGYTILAAFGALSVLVTNTTAELVVALALVCLAAAIVVVVVNLRWWRRTHRIVDAIREGKLAEAKDLVTTLRRAAPKRGPGAIYLKAVDATLLEMDGKAAEALEIADAVSAARLPIKLRTVIVRMIEATRFDCHAERGELDEAKKSLTTLDRLGSTDDELLDLVTRAEVARLEGNQDEAIKLFQEALDREGLSPTTLSACHRRLGDLRAAADPDAARAHYREAADAAPELASSRAAQTSLDALGSS